MIFRISSAITLVSLLLAFLAASLFARFSSVSRQGILLCFFIVLLASGCILALAVFERRSPIFGPIFWKGKAGLKQVSLTFDDGPNEPFTSRIADILREYGVKATFFVIGSNCKRFPDALRRLTADGHEMGNHTWTHEVLPLKSPSQIEQELEDTSEAISQITGKRPTLFRAPHGWRNPWVGRVARKCGCTPVAWTLGVWDTDRPGTDVIVNRTLKGVEDGCVLLVHDGRGVEEKADSGQLVQALPAIIAELQRRGFRFVTLSEMMETGGR